MTEPKNVKGYRLWSLKQEKIIVSRDVIFEEEVFPFKILKLEQNGVKDTKECYYSRK